jgi:hypothetical protein
LPQPLATWLTKSYLTQLSDRSCVLLVDSYTKHLINDLALLAQIYPLVQAVYPDVTSLYISSTSFQSLIKDNKLLIYTVENL